jgi:hypothetical protein
MLALFWKQKLGRQRNLDIENGVLDIVKQNNALTCTEHPLELQLWINLHAKLHKRRKNI